MSEEAVRLLGSDKPLKFPDGSIQSGVLESLLYNSYEDNLSPDQKIIVTHHRRVADFDEDNPEWEDVEHKVTFRDLLTLYREFNGKDYVKPSQEVYEAMLKKGYFS